MELLVTGVPNFWRTTHHKAKVSASTVSAKTPMITQIRKGIAAAPTVGVGVNKRNNQRW
ncbi:MAG: hypothetical protein WCP58_04520 [bacterium]|jgi:hypothetical protein